MTQKTKKNKTKQKKPHSHLHTNPFTFNICISINNLYAFCSILHSCCFELAKEISQYFSFLENVSAARAKRDSGSGPTPDALLLAPRATERFLRLVKPAGCAQGSKIQQIPGQLSGDSYFVKGHTKPKTLQIFESDNYRLTKLIRHRIPLINPLA